MAYWKDSAKNTRQLDSFGLATNHSAAKSGNREFHEIEFGLVLDIVLDLSHPIYSGAHPMQTKIDSDRWPADLNGLPPTQKDPDLTWIGRALIRPLVSGKNTKKDQLMWAYPLENNFSEYPLINETVILYESDDGNRLYYSRKVNFRNWPNNNLDFTIEGAVSGAGNTTLFSQSPYTGKIKSQTNWKGDMGRIGYAGKYYYANPKIRTIRRFEGDIVMESRHGSEVIMKAFDKNRDNDIGAYPDYANGGNPMLILRNRQRQLLKEGQTLSLKNSPNPATVVGTIEEKNVGGYLDENINHDGSSIYMTSGKTISEWVTTCYKKMFGTGEEVDAFNGTTSFTYPKLDGDQIVIQSDRLIFSARYGEMFHYAKKRYGIVTDSEYTVDAHDQIVMTTHVKTVLNSPLIYLGEYDQSGEPVLLGQTTVNWLYELCNWLLNHTHWHHHVHPDAVTRDGESVDTKQEEPHQTQTPVQVLQLTALRDNLQVLMSRRVFVTGGGYAPGQDGATI